MGKTEEKIQAMGITIPDTPKPVASYVPCVQTGNLVYTSGQGCKKDGVIVYKGKLGKDVSVEDGYKAAKIAIINCLAILKGHLGSLDKIKRIVKLLGFVACVPEFDQQPSVINGASDFLLEIFEEMHPAAAGRIEEGASIDEHAQNFLERVNSNKAKSELAHCLAIRLESDADLRDKFTVPNYIKDAIRWVVKGE